MLAEQKEVLADQKEAGSVLAVGKIKFKSGREVRTEAALASENRRWHDSQPHASAEIVSLPKVGHLRGHR